MLRTPLARLARSAPSSTLRAFSSTPSASKHILNAGPDELRAALLPENERLTLIDFYAEWCGPCKVLTPALKSVIPDDSTTVDLLTIDTDAQQELAAAFKVAALPTVLAVRAGKPVSKFVGARSPAQIKAFLEECQA
ncbi:thioredoxin-like protein [Leucosporidium creatinivorum]|uniref:Thioredoxin-like protein n=1 Tax=Leucosporidium creatinivorum TaxID=106004 RepID=A0A1Y2G5M4_9BASI|nr:thioredoxin-like protein [Leucosporidium creatinivorum]